MRSTSVRVRSQSGAGSALVLGLTALAGFIAGATAVGMMALDLTGGSVTAASSGAAVTHSVGWEAPASEFDRWRNSIGGEAVLTWPYESGGRSVSAAPGPHRADRLGGPEGWTPDPPVGP